MNRQITQQDLSLLRQQSQTVMCKIDLLNTSFKKIDELEGELVEDSFTIDADSAIRRTCSLTFVIKNKSFLLNNQSRIWFDKYIKIWFGLVSQRDGNVYYYPMGTYTFDSTLYSFDPATSTLSLSCVDLMGNLDGTRNGQLSALTTLIPVGSNIRSSIISAVTQLGGIKKYQIQDVGKTTPYDISFSSGDTVYDVIQKIIELHPGWEYYFEDDMFICKEIPTCDNDAIFIDSNTLSPLVISENISNSFTEVKNCTEVWGKCLDANYYSDSVTNTGSQYNVNISNIELNDNKLIAFKVNVNNLNNPTIKINALTAYPILDLDGNALTANTLKLGKSYVFRYKSNTYTLLGQFQIHAINKLYSYMPSAAFIAQDKINENCDNITYTVIPDSPYCIDKIGLIRNVLSGADYEKIYSDDLAIQRAEYENWRTTRLTDNVNIDIVPIPWLDVNKKIEYKSNLTGETNAYITKKISGSIKSGTMNVDMIKFYPLYNF